MTRNIIILFVLNEDTNATKTYQTPSDYTFWKTTDDGSALTYYNKISIFLITNVLFILYEIIMSEVENIFESFEFVTYYHDPGVNGNTAQKYFY